MVGEGGNILCTLIIQYGGTCVDKNRAFACSICVFVICLSGLCLAQTITREPRQLPSQPSEIGMVTEFLNLKGVKCDFHTNDAFTQVTVVLSKLYKDNTTKDEAIPEVFPNFKTAYTACGMWVDRMTSSVRYAHNYVKDTVSAKK